jgi:hypothetical protein
MNTEALEVEALYAMGSFVRDAGAETACLTIKSAPTPEF